MTRPLMPFFSAVWRPTNARWLNDLSFRPPMSVTRHALKAALCAADAEPALEERDAGGLGGHDPLDCLVEERILVGVELAVVAVGVLREHDRRLEEALVHLLLAL